MDDNEHVQKWIQVVCSPKGIEYMSTRVLNGENVNQKYHAQKKKSGNASGSLETPSVKFGHFIVAAF